MCSRHRPLNGADSAEALADSDFEEMLAGLDRIIHDPELQRTLIDAGLLVRTRPKCAACSLRAQPYAVYCAGHLRLGEYRVTDPEHWASNE